MGIVEKYKVYEMKKNGITQTRMIRIPKGIQSGREASIVGNRVLLIDPRGEIDTESLLDFFEECVEPAFWNWFVKWKDREKQRKEKEREGKAEGEK